MPQKALKKKRKINQKKNKEISESSKSEENDKKIISKKTKRKKSEDSDSESSEKKVKPKKVEKKPKAAHDSDEDDDDDDSENQVKPKVVKKEKKQKKESSDEEESEKKESKNKKGKSESDSEEEEEEEKEKKEKNKNKIKKEESEDEDNSDSEENKKNKKENNKKEENDDDDEDDNEEPKLVKNESKEEEEEENKKEKKSYNSGTWPELFVNNLSYNTTDESLRNYFGKYGEIESTKIVHDKETGRPKGVGFCKFCDPSSAAKALKDNDNLFLDGRPISVSYSNDKKGSAKVRKSNFKGDRNYQGEKYSIFIGNLSFKTNEDGIKNVFEDCGKIIDIRIAKTPEGKPRGFAHVDFDSNEAVENALEKSGYKLDGRELRIDRTTNKPSNTKGVFGEHSYKKFKKDNKDNKENKDTIDLDKAKKTGKIINTGSKSQKIENSDDDDDDDE